MMIRFIQILIFILFSVLNGYCQIEGQYKSKEINLASRFNMIFLGDHYMGGNTLNLHKDSTYELTTCGILENGKWHLEADSLVLIADTAVYRIDSLEQATPFYSIAKKPQITKYHFSDDVLFREVWVGMLENKYIVKDVLIKED